MLNTLEVVLLASRQYKCSRIIVSGGAVSNEHYEARVMRQWLIERNVAKDRISVDDAAQDTVGNVCGAARLLDGCKRLVLVTVQWHMPRVRAIVDACQSTAVLDPGMIVVECPAPNEWWWWLWRTPRTERSATTRDVERVLQRRSSAVHRVAVP